MLFFWQRLIFFAVLIGCTYVSVVICRLYVAQCFVLCVLCFFFLFLYLQVLHVLQSLPILWTLNLILICPLETFESYKKLLHDIRVEFGRAG